MAPEDSHASTQLDDFLATMSRWATFPPVIPLLTGLCFVASTVFVYVWVDCSPWSGHGSYDISDALPMAIVCFVLGVGVGLPLLRGVVRIRDTGKPRPGIRVLAAVGATWVLAFLFQCSVFAIIEMSL